MKASSYLSRGVSPTKDDVKLAVASQSKGLFPGSFCKLIPDLAGDEAWCMAVHADGAGTKSALAWMMFRETGSTGWFNGIAQDSLVMNIDDLLCIGATSGFLLSNTIGRNAHLVDAACLQAVISGYDQAIDHLNRYGAGIVMTGGETADVGDLVRTMICDSTVTVRLPREHVINAADIRPDQVIIGLSSSGRMNGEDRENSGIGSNGLTAARHLMLSDVYRERYPQTYAETIDRQSVYCGAWQLDDALPGSSLTVGEALLSPTRSYLPVVAQILPLYQEHISGLIHCTGGGQIKCRDFGHGIRYVKDQLFDRPAIFEAIAQSGQINEPEMYQVFNMGHRMELYCDESVAGAILAICRTWQLDAKIIGHTEASSDPGHNEVIIHDRGQTLRF